LSLDAPPFSGEATPPFEPVFEGAACAVKLQGFEGPLDLLLFLIKNFSQFYAFYFIFCNSKFFADFIANFFLQTSFVIQKSRNSIPIAWIEIKFLTSLH